MGWDGFGGYHGLLLKRCAELVDMGATRFSILDVGCGLCHLYELLKDHADPYVGIEKDPRILEMVRQRYPHLRILEGTVYDLGIQESFDYVFAIGLYSDKPKKPDGVIEMLRYTKQKLIITYWKDEGGAELPFVKVHEVQHEIDPRLAIVEITP